MTRECCSILSSGRKCRCAATRNQSVCRHHAPKPAVPTPPRPPKSEYYSDLIRWRRLGRDLPWLQPDSLASEVYDILECLIDRGENSTGHISDLTAGRFLRAILNRLGEVPFPNPEFAPAAPQLAPQSVPPLNNHSADALLATLAKQGLFSADLLREMSSPASPASLHQSRARVNQ